MEPVSIRQRMLDRLANPAHHHAVQPLEEKRKAVPVWDAEILEKRLQEVEKLDGRVHFLKASAYVVFIAATALAMSAIAFTSFTLSITAITVGTIAFATLGLYRYLQYSQKHLEAQFDTQARLANWKIKQVQGQIQNPVPIASLPLNIASIQDAPSVSKQADRLLSIFQDQSRISENHVKEALSEINVLAQLLNSPDVNKKFIDEEQNVSFEKLVVAAIKSSFADQLVPALLSLQFPDMVLFRHISPILTLP